MIKRERALAWLACAALLAGCSADGQPAMAHAEAPVDIEASAMGTDVLITLRNSGSEATCIPSGDLVPGYGSTLVRDVAGEIISSSISGELVEFKGLNLTNGLIVIPPDSSVRRTIHLDEAREAGDVGFVQVRFDVIQCSELFDHRVDRPRPIYVSRVYALVGQAVQERTDLTFSDTDPPPGDGDSYR